MRALVGVIMSQGQKEIQKRARDLRSNQTGAEGLLWMHLRNRQLNNLKFRRQHPIGNYIVDFYCAEVGVIVEIDGDTHLDQVDYDQTRTEWLERQGLRVIRFNNQDVYDNPTEVLTLIAEFCAGCL